jgi:uncharacterized protein (DUF2147 family)
LEKNNKIARLTRVLPAALMMLLAGAPALAAVMDADTILGRWRDASGRVEIEIYKDSGKYHGKIVWLKEPNYRENDRRGMGGKPRIDRDNPDPALRIRPLMHMDLIRGCVFSDNGRWEKGALYDPLRGRTYGCSISMDGTGKLNVRGYIGLELLGRTMILKRNNNQRG